jgi:Flp pilus assembly protein TadG
MAAASVFHRFAASRRGVAAVEFALVLPFLLATLLASFDAGNAIAIYMKVRSATFALAAITNTYTNSSDPTNDPIQAADMSSITSATSAVLAPYSSAPAVIKITQIKAASSTSATVSWSYSVNGTAYTKGSPWTKFPSQLTSTNSCNSYPCYLIFAEVAYTFTPSFGYFITGPIVLSDNVYVAPRSSTCVAYVPITGTTC